MTMFRFDDFFDTLTAADAAGLRLFSCMRDEMRKGVPQNLTERASQLMNHVPALGWPSAVSIVNRWSLEIQADIRARLEAPARQAAE